MKTKITLLVLFIVAINTLYSQDAGIVNPVDNLIIHKNNRDLYFQNGDWDDMKIDGWSNTGKIRQLIVYYKSASSTSYNSRVVSNGNSGSWDTEMKVRGGVYQIYINVKCNYVGCLQVGTNSDIRTITYVRPFEARHMYIPPTNDEHITIKRYRDYGITGLNTGFYFRTLRNTQPNAATATIISTFDQDEYFL